jgi:hypothetical protein
LYKERSQREDVLIAMGIHPIHTPIQSLPLFKRVMVFGLEIYFGCKMFSLHNLSYTWGRGGGDFDAIWYEERSQYLDVHITKG